MGRTGHPAVEVTSTPRITPALILGLTCLAVVAAGTSVALTRGEVPIAQAATVLGPVHDAQVTAANGVSLPARAGQRLPNGAVVTTGAAGDAQLITRGRTVMLAADAADQVLDGARQQLRTGTAVVDAQQGAGLSLTVAGDSIDVPTGSATEADRNVTVRIGALAGPASITAGSGRHAILPALSQTVLDGDALPTDPTALHLTDSPDEARAVPTLVSDDLALKTLSAGIDATGRSAARTVEASWTGQVAPAPAGTGLGDSVLPFVIADAATHGGGTAQLRYDHVVAWRATGGSWGVVVQLLSTRASNVVATLSALEQNQPVGQIGTVATRALGSPAGPGIPGVTTHHHSGSTPPATTPPSSPPPTTGSNPTPTPTPTSGDGVVGGLVDTVGGVLSTVVGLLPLSTTAQTPAATTKTTTPTTTTSPGLLGGLLGGLTSK